MIKKVVVNRFGERLFANFVFLILLTSIFSYSAIAQIGEINPEDAGTTPNSLFYGFELWWENRQINSADTIEEKFGLEKQFLAERYAEMHEMVLEGNGDAARTAAEEARRIYAGVSSDIEGYIDENRIDLEQVRSGKSELHNLIVIEKDMVGMEDNYLSQIRELTDKQVEDGNINEDLAEDIIAPVEEGSAAVGSTIFEEKEGIVGKLAKEVPKIEAEVVVARTEEETGIGEQYKKIVSVEQIEGLKDKVEDLNKQARNLEKSGDLEGFAALGIFISNAELHLQKSEYALENKVYGRAYGRLTNAEHLIYDAERRISEEGLSMDYVREVIGEPIDFINAEIDEERENSEGIARSYEDESYRSDFETRYPEYKDYYEAENRRAEKSEELTNKLRDEGVMDKWLEELRAEDLSEPEVMAELGKKWDYEFKNVYGEEWIPPGFIQPKERNDEERNGNGDERAKKSKELTNKLRDEGVMSKWTEELKASGLPEAELNTQLGKRWDEEYEKFYGEEWIPPGLIQHIEGEEDGSYKNMPVWPPVDVIPIGRIDIDVDHETGKKKIIGWYDNGEFHGNIDWGGGCVRGIDYKDPLTGNNYIFDGGIYRYTTPAGVVYEEAYPLLGEEGKVFDPMNDFKRGDEVYTYYNKNSEGDIVEYSYSATGYEADVKTEIEVVEKQDEEIDIIKGIETSGVSGEEGTSAEGEATSEKEIKANTELAYPTGTYVVEGGGRIEESPNSFVYIDESGILSEWDYDPSYKTYINPETGKVFDPVVSYHDEAINYDVIDNTYKYSGPEGEWKTSGVDGKWIAPDGSEVQKGYVPAPIGYEDKKEYTTPSGENWKYDTESATWGKFDSSGARVGNYAPPPNHYSYYDGREGKYIDYKGNTYSPDQWQNEGLRGQPYVSSGKTWNYNSATGTWESSQGEQYDPTTAAYTGGSGKDSNYGYGRVYDSSGREVNSYSYNYGYNVYNPDGSMSYYSSQTPSSNANAPQSYTDYSGRAWARNNDGTWSVSGGDYAEVGRTVSYEGKTYTVTQDKGWTDESGNAVAPPPGQSSSAVSGGYGGYYGSGYSGGYYGTSAGSTSGAAIGSTYTSSDGKTYTKTEAGDWKGSDGLNVGTPPGYTPSGGSYGAGIGAGQPWGPGMPGYTPGYVPPSGSGGYYYGGSTGSGPGYYGSDGTYSGGTYSGSYGSYGGAYAPDGSYASGGYYDSSGSYTAPSGGYYSGSYSGDGSYSGGGTYSGGTTGTYSGSYSGDSGSYSGSTSTATSGSTGDSGSTSTSSSSTTSSSGGDSGSTSSGTSSGGDSGGSTSTSTGAFIKEFNADNKYSLGDALGYMFEKIF
ncbi:MAG: DUF5667 domain-containing protein [Nanoarchaeota archaeon]|nr:DUF5667 domain-containing protein [Nanoarchaeota archaeon]